MEKIQIQDIFTAEDYQDSQLVFAPSGVKGNTFIKDALEKIEGYKKNIETIRDKLYMVTERGNIISVKTHFKNKTFYEAVLKSEYDILAKWFGVTTTTLVDKDFKFVKTMRKNSIEYVIDATVLIKKVIEVNTDQFLKRRQKMSKKIDFNKANKKWELIKSNDYEFILSEFNQSQVRDTDTENEKEPSESLLLKDPLEIVKGTINSLNKRLEKVKDDILFLKESIEKIKQKKNELTNQNGVLNNDLLSRVFSPVFCMRLQNLVKEVHKATSFADPPGARNPLEDIEGQITDFNKQKADIEDKLKKLEDIKIYKLIDKHDIPKESDNRIIKK